MITLCYKHELLGISLAYLREGKAGDGPHPLAGRRLAEPPEKAPLRQTPMTVYSKEMTRVLHRKVEAVYRCENRHPV